MLILAIILVGMLAGAAAQLMLGRQDGRVNWSLAFAAGLAGSFLGGLVVSLASGDGLALRPSGLLGSVLGALVVTGAWRWWTSRTTASH